MMKRSITTDGADVDFFSEHVLVQDEFKGDQEGKEKE